VAKAIVDSERFNAGLKTCATQKLHFSAACKARLKLPEVQG